MSSISSNNNSNNNNNKHSNKSICGNSDKFTHEFYRENVEKHRKFYLRYHVVETHVPNLKAAPISSKFYSKHEQLAETDKTRQCLQILEQKSYSGPKQKYARPMLENQKYGWISDPLTEYDGKDYGILYRPKLKHDLTKLGEIISREKITERPNFNGLQFKLVV